MQTLAPPVVRCRHCGGWLVHRPLEPVELPTLALICLACAADWEIIAGGLVAITRPAGSPPLAPVPPVDRSGWRGPGRPRKVEATP